MLLIIKLNHFKKKYSRELACRFFVNAPSSLSTKIMRQLTALNTVLTYRFDKSQQLFNTASIAHMPQEIGAATELISPLRLFYS